MDDMTLIDRILFGIILLTMMLPIFVLYGKFLFALFEDLFATDKENKPLAPAKKKALLVDLLGKEDARQLFAEIEEMYPEEDIKGENHETKQD